jgi:hypothetical protein
MAQSRLRDFEEPIESFEHNIFNLGLHPPGRYCGFDSLVSTQVGATLTFEIHHIGTGFSYKNQVDDTKGPIGLILTPQGVLIQQDNVIALQIDSNAGNSEKRFDLVYLDHTFTVVPGGADATYAIKKGAVGTPIKPIVTDPLHHVAIGMIEIPPNATDIGDCIYVKMKCPDSGDGEDARLDTPNVFNATQFDKMDPQVYTIEEDTYVSGANTARLWAVPPEGNTYQIMPIAGRTLDGFVVKDVQLQEGARISIMINENVTLRESILFLSQPVADKGYKAFKIPIGLANINVGGSGGASLFGVKPSAGEIWELQLLYFQGKWTLIGIGGAGTKSPYIRGMIIPWFGDVNTNFDATGLGVNLCAGFALTNTLNGTPEGRGKLLAMATDVPAAGALIDTTDETTIIAGGADPEDYILSVPNTYFGKKSHQLSQAELPSVNFPVTDPGHFHFLVNPAENGALGTTNYISKQHGTGGNTGYDLFGSNAAPTQARSQTVTTGITVNSGGASQHFDTVPPVFITVFMMKL